MITLMGSLTIIFYLFKRSKCETLHKRFQSKFARNIDTLVIKIKFNHNYENSVFKIKKTLKLITIIIIIIDKWPMGKETGNNNTSCVFVDNKIRNKER